MLLEETESKNAYDLMDELAAATSAGAEGLFLMPFFGGACSPHQDIYGRKPERTYFQNGRYCGKTVYYCRKYRLL